jgi:hypothetical protein
MGHETVLSGLRHRNAASARTNYDAAGSGVASVVEGLSPNLDR